MSLLRYIRRGSCLSFFMPANVKEILVQFWCSWNGRHGNYRKNGAWDPYIWLLHRYSVPYIGGGHYGLPLRVAYTEEGAGRVLFRPLEHPAR
jgi:hypothetical protein